MSETFEAVVETALIKMLFALADLEGLESPVEVLIAKENITAAIEDLARVAPRFNFDEHVAAARRANLKKIKPFIVHKSNRGEI